MSSQNLCFSYKVVWHCMELLEHTLPTKCQPLGLKNQESMPKTAGSLVATCSCLLKKVNLHKLPCWNDHIYSIKKHADSLAMWLLGLGAILIYKCANTGSWIALLSAAPHCWLQPPHCICAIGAFWRILMKFCHMIWFPLWCSSSKKFILQFW